MRATLLLSLFALAPVCVAQDASKAPAKPPFVVEAGELELPQLVDRCAAYLDCNIVWNKMEMGPSGAIQPVRLQKALRLDRDGCEEFLANTLYLNGLALTSLDAKGTMLEIVNMTGPRSREVTARAVERSVEQILARPALRMPVTTTVQLEHTNVIIVSNSLRPFFASTGGSPTSVVTLGSLGNGQTLLITGMQDQVAQAIQIVRKGDVKPSPEMGGMPDAQDRIAALERRVAALEAQLAAAKPAAK